MELLLFFGGAAISWLLCHIYYRKSSKDQVAVFNKLSEDVREAILRNPNDVIRHDELMRILDELKNGPLDASRLTGTIDGGTF